MRARIAIERGLQDIARRARKRVGKDRLGLHDAAIAEAGLARDHAQPVDDDDRSPARLQMQRGGDADHAGAEDDDVCCGWHARVLLESRPFARNGADLAMGCDFRAPLL